MKIALGADHAGFELKQKIKDHLIAQGVHPRYAMDILGLRRSASR